MLGSCSTLWVVVMSGQCVLGSLTHFRWFAKCPKCGETLVTLLVLIATLGELRGNTQSELVQTIIIVNVQCSLTARETARPLGDGCAVAQQYNHAVSRPAQSSDDVTH